MTMNHHLHAFTVCNDHDQWECGFTWPNRTATVKLERTQKWSSWVQKAMVFLGQCRCSYWKMPQGLRSRSRSKAGGLWNGVATGFILSLVINIEYSFALHLDYFWTFLDLATCTIFYGNSSLGQPNLSWENLRTASVTISGSRWCAPRPKLVPQWELQRKDDCHFLTFRSIDCMWWTYQFVSDASLDWLFQYMIRSIQKWVYLYVTCFGLPGGCGFQGSAELWVDLGLWEHVLFPCCVASTLAVSKHLVLKTMDHYHI